MSLKLAPQRNNLPASASAQDAAYAAAAAAGHFAADRQEACHTAAASACAAAAAAKAYLASLHVDKHVITSVQDTDHLRVSDQSFESMGLTTGQHIP